MNESNGGKAASFFRRLGPGMLLAATSIGASHLVMSPRAGWMFGFQLLWLVPLTHLFKYHAFEFGPRYAAATGESLIAGYARVPGPRAWTLWILLAGTILQGVGVLAAVVAIAAAVLSTFIGSEPFGGFYVGAVIATVLLFLILGGYGWLDWLNKVMMTLLFLATVVVFIPALPDSEQLKHFVIPSAPTGSVAVIAGLLGWMPTGIDVSIWHSLWTLEKHPDLAGDNTSPGRYEIYKFSLVDMRVGYALSFIVASVFLLVAAAYLHGTSNRIDGADFARSLASIYTRNFGSWMYPVFMLAAFTAMYSTVYAVMDGFARSFAETVSTIFPETRTRWRGRFYWMFSLSAAAFAFIVLAVLKGRNPVSLVLDVALLSLCVAPLYYLLNYYCVTRFIEDRRFRPGRAVRVVSVAGIIVVSAATLICVASKLGILK